MCIFHWMQMMGHARPCHHPKGSTYPRGGSRRTPNVHFSLDADDGFGCIVKGNNFCLELGLKSLAVVYLED